MTKIMTYEEIGKYCVDWFIAEQERVKARIDRAKAHQSHKCQVTDTEYSEDDTGSSASFCYHRQSLGNGDYLPVNEWCDNCKYVQVFHVAYHQAARKAQIARYNLSRRIKNMLPDKENKNE